MSARPRARVRSRQRLLRWVVITVTMLFFALPLLGMLEYTTRDVNTGARTLQTWVTLADFGKISAQYPDLRTGFLASIGLAVLTPIVMLALLVPTMTWVRLRLPGLSRTVEFVCLLPLTVPAIVLVVGLTPIYSWIPYLSRELGLGTAGESNLWLSLAYVILVLPYAYRSLDTGLRAIDVKTLSEAARSLGASWAKVMWRIVLPNLRTAVLSASFLSVALVLGEFTIANLFAKKNLQVAMYLLAKSDAQISVAVGLASLVFAFVVLFAMSFIGGTRRATPWWRRVLRTSKESA